MPERLDHVTILLNDGPIVISGEGRQILVNAFAVGLHPGLDVGVAESFLGVLRAFEAEGGTGPVVLTPEQRILLFNVLRTWSRNEKRAIDPDEPMPAELALLHDALTDDLHNAEQQAGP